MSKSKNHAYDDYDDYDDDLVLAMWTSGTRYEFRDADSYYQITPWSEQTGFTRAWYTGPGGYEYTEVINTVQSVLLATQFLEGMGLKYLFVLMIVFSDCIAQGPPPPPPCAHPPCSTVPLTDHLPVLAVSSLVFGYIVLKNNNKELKSFNQ